MKHIEWLDDERIKIDPPKRTKKVTGTRFASILGYNVWSTPFEMWLAITKTYEEPFEDTIYTIAGKTIEPKQAQYMKDEYYMDIVTPEDRYGKDYFQKTWGDFFPESKHFGGMWDFLGVNEDGEVDTVLEMKTTKRVEDWLDDVPEYYAMQAGLYAYLLGVDKVIMVASFLKDEDYVHPDRFECSVENTVTREFKVSERYPNMQDLVDYVEAWWNHHVTTGISPIYDEKKDAELLKALRTNSLSPQTEVKLLVKELEETEDELEQLLEKHGIKDKEERIKTLKNLIKEHCIKQFREGDDRVELAGTHRTYTTTKSVSNRVDTKKLKADGLTQYFKQTETYTLRESK